MSNHKHVKILLARLLALMIMLQAGTFTIFAYAYDADEYSRPENIHEDYEPVLTELWQSFADITEDRWTPEDRNRVPVGEDGEPAPRSDLEADMWRLVVGHGQRLWGTPNEYNAARYVFDRFNEIPGIQGVTHFIEGRGSAHGNSLSVPWNARLVFGGDLPDIYGNPFPANDTFMPVANAQLVDLGTFPNLVLPDNTTGNVVAIVRTVGGNPNIGNINTVLNNLEEENDGLSFVGVLTGRSDTFTVSGVIGTATAARPFMTTSSHFLNYAAERANYFQFMERFQRTTSNSVFATLPASTDNPDIIIVVTSHLDSVLASPGAADNASGTAASIELARRLSSVNRGNIEMIFMTSGAHEGGGMRGSVHIAEKLNAEGRGDIAINLNMDIIQSVGPRPNGTPIDAISMDIFMPAGSASGMAGLRYNLPAYLVVGEARQVWTPGQAGIDNVRIFRFGGSDHTQFTNRGIEAASMIMVDDVNNDLEIQYHNSRDNMNENYCYDRLNLAVDLMHNALTRAVNQQITKQAQFYVDSDNNILVLANARQMFLTFDRVEGILILPNTGGAEISFVFDSPSAFFAFDCPSVDFEDAAFVIRNVLASGEGIWDNSNEARASNPAHQHLNRFQSAMRPVFVDAPCFGFNIFNNGNSNNQSLANLGVIRLWTQLNGVSTKIPYAGLEVTATLPNGQDAMQFVNINRIWNNIGYVNLIDVRKDASWQNINFTVTIFGQKVEVLLINDLYVQQTFGLQAFNNGNDNNASLANLGVIRIWTQINGVNNLVPTANLTVTAVDQDGNNAIEFVRVNHIWSAPDNVNLIDVTKVDANWQTISLTATLGSQTIELLLINNRFTTGVFTDS